MSNFANAIQALLDQNNTTFEELHSSVQSRIIEMLDYYKRSVQEVATIDGSSGFAAEGLVQVALMLATDNGEYISHSTKEDQIQRDIDFMTTEGSVSVKSPMQSSPEGRNVGATYKAFNIEMYAGSRFSSEEEGNTKGWAPGWGVTGKADMLFIVAHDRVMVYDYAKLKDITKDMPVKRNTPEIEERVRQSGRPLYKTQTKVVPYVAVREAERKDMQMALGLFNIREALLEGGYNV